MHQPLDAAKCSIHPMWGLKLSRASHPLLPPPPRHPPFVNTTERPWMTKISSTQIRKGTMKLLWLGLEYPTFPIPSTELGDRAWVPLCMKAKGGGGEGGDGQFLIQIIILSGYMMCSCQEAGRPICSWHEHLIYIVYLLTFPYFLHHHWALFSCTGER